jgi:hypothetical protein
MNNNDYCHAPKSNKSTTRHITPTSTVTSTIVEKEETFDINNILLNLKIIAGIQKYNKLLSSSNDNILKIDNNNTLYQGIFRWYYNETRIHTLEIIEKLIDDIFNIINQVIGGKLTIDKNNILTYNNSNLIQQLCLELTNALTGLENLKFTYSTDQTIEARLNIVIHKIRLYITQIGDTLIIQK